MFCSSILRRNVFRHFPRVPLLDRFFRERHSQFAETGVHFSLFALPFEWLAGGSDGHCGERLADGIGDVLIPERRALIGAAVVFDLRLIGDGLPHVHVGDAILERDVPLRIDGDDLPDFCRECSGSGRWRRPL
jgi:hypothetical protein